MGSAQLSQLRLARDRLWWVESRPRENGRNVILSCLREGGEAREEIPSSMNARNRVNEYGSGCYCVGENALWFTNDADQRIYRSVEANTIAITPKSDGNTTRYCDLQLTVDEAWIICQRERHLPESTVLNDLVILPADGSAEPRVLASGRDFYGALRLRPDGLALAFIAWDHPLMPWDGCELFVAQLSKDGELAQSRLVAGNSRTSVVHPSWSPSGQLHFVSDEDGWWNLHGLIDEEVVNLCPMAAEFGAPPWAFWHSMHAHLQSRLIAAVYIQDGQEHLGLLRPGSIAIEDLDLPFASYGQGGELQSDGDQSLFVIASSTAHSARIYCIRPNDGACKELYRPADADPDRAYISTPQALRFPTGDDEIAHAFYYPPANTDVIAPQDEKPPLLVMCHGGPTAATAAALNLKVQFWTSRGFAVLDVNYRGSTGFGRAYREAIKGRSGIVETQDCLAAARAVVARGLADPARLAIRGGSAGGYIVLSCAVFSDRLNAGLVEASENGQDPKDESSSPAVAKGNSSTRSQEAYFSAGTSLYGISDLQALVRHTHKFESHYPFTLIAPYPEGKQVYHDRSPLHFVGESCFPLLLMQGTDDPVVPLAQAQAMVQELRRSGKPFAYLEFDGEGHGFRRAGNVIRAFEAELAFYSEVFGFELPDELPVISIENTTTEAN